MKLNKAISLAVCLLLVFVFTACGGSTTEEGRTGICDWCGSKATIQEVMVADGKPYLCEDCLEYYYENYGTCDNCGAENVEIAPIEEGSDFYVCLECAMEFDDMDEYDENDDEDIAGEDEYSNQGSSYNANDGQKVYDEPMPGDLISKKITPVHVDALYIEGQKIYDAANGNNYYYKYKMHPYYVTDGGATWHINKIHFQITCSGLTDPPYSYAEWYISIYDENGKLLKSDLGTAGLKEKTSNFTYETDKDVLIVEFKAYNAKSFDYSWSGTGYRFEND